MHYVVIIFIIHILLWWFFTLILFDLKKSKGNAIKQINRRIRLDHLNWLTQTNSIIISKPLIKSQWFCHWIMKVQFCYVNKFKFYYIISYPFSSLSWFDMINCDDKIHGLTWIHCDLFLFYFRSHWFPLTQWWFHWVNLSQLCFDPF